MNTERAYEILCQVAKHNGVTVEQVMGDIEKAIDHAITTARECNDLMALAAWEKIPRKGSKPTAVEVVAAFGEEMITGGSF